MFSGIKPGFLNKPKDNRPTKKIPNAPKVPLSGPYSQADVLDAMDKKARANSRDTEGIPSDLGGSDSGQ